ncbi:hypothetical protein U3A55_03470 [Salarchaeum sp. III]
MPATAVDASSIRCRHSTSFRVELGHLDGTVHLCVRCSPGGPATYWTRDLDDHVVESE